MPPQTPSDHYPREPGGPGDPRFGQVPAQYPRQQSGPADPRFGQAPAQPAGPAPAPQAPGRRSILRGAVGAGVIGIAAAAGAGAAVAATRHSGAPTMMPVSKPVAKAPMAPSAMAGPLVVYIADTTSGLFNVFGGTGQTQINNPALVNQFLANLKLA